MRRLLLGATLALLLPAAAGGQLVRGGLTAQRYTFADPAHAGLAEATLLWVPLSVTLPIGRFTWSVDGAWASATVDGGSGEAATLSMPSDARIGVQARFAGSRVTLGAGAIVQPRGGALSLAEVRVLGTLASPLLPFAADSWTGASGWVGTAALSVPAGRGSLRFEGGWTVRGARAMLEGDDVRYRPGDAWHARVSGGLPAGRTGVFSFVLARYGFLSDAVDGRDVFASGPRTELLAAYAFPVGLEASARTYAGLRHRGNAEPTYAVDWLPGVLDAPPRLLAIAGVDARIVGGGFTILPDAGVRVLRAHGGSCFHWSTEDTSFASRCPAGQGWVASIGAALELGVAGGRWHPSVIVEPSVHAHVGRIVDRGQGSAFEGGFEVEHDPRSSGVTGWEVGVAVRTGGVR